MHKKHLKRKFVSLTATIITVIFILLSSQGAKAHPPDMYFQTQAIHLTPDQARLDWEIAPGPILVPGIWHEADTNQDQVISSAEARAWAAPLLNQLDTAFDNRPLSWQLESVAWPTTIAAMEAGEESIQLHLTAVLTANLSGQHQLNFHNQFQENLSLYWFHVYGEETVTFYTPERTHGQLALNLHVGPIGSQADAPLQTFWDSGHPLENVQTDIQPVKANGETAVSTTTTTSRPLAILTDLVQTAERSTTFYAIALIIAVLLGALHALTPGHGKTVVAAYLVGAKGTTRHAITLGLVVTLTHIGSVLILGTVALVASQYILPTSLIPVLEILSGLLIVGLGLNLLRHRWRAWRTPHTHHDHDHDHPHHHHAIPDKLTWRALLTLGISGGLVPCPDAIAILLLAIAINQIPFGLTLIVTFSLGLALVLIAIGLLTIHSRRLLEKLTAFQRLSPTMPLVSAGVVLLLGMGLTFNAAQHANILDMIFPAPAPETAQSSFVQDENGNIEVPSLSTLPEDTEGPTFSFIQNYIDTAYGGNGKPGWVRAGDIDNDGDLDLMAGGGSAMFAYENDGDTTGSWTRYGNLDSSSQIGANGAILYDVDGDNDLDVVSAKFNSDVGWWENPGGPLSGTPWSFHVLSSETRYLHDIHLADLDEDGTAEEFIANLNQGYWDANITIKWFRPGADPEQPWEAHVIEANRAEGAPHGHAGFDVGDVDKDGNVDIAYSNGWYEAPDDPSGSWTWHEVTQIYGISNTLLRDMDGDTHLDLVVSGGHHGQGVFWLENPAPSGGSWPQHNVSAVDGDVTQRYIYSAGAPEHLHHPECLGILDMDEDGDLDAVACDLFFGEDPGEPDWSDEAHNIYVFVNEGNATSWTKYNVAPNSYPVHLLKMVDVNEDGLIDMIGEAAGHSVVSYYENNGQATVATPTICPNGGTYNSPVNVTLNTTTPGASIYYTLNNTPPTTSSTLYSSPFPLNNSATVRAKAFRTGWLDSGEASAAFTINAATGFAFDLDVVDDSYPGNGRPGWSASGDLNGDDQIDVIAGGGSAVHWYEAPTWTRHPIENPTSTGGNGGLIVDVDRDGNLDVVSALFNAQLVWWENPTPGDVTAPWPRHTIDATSPQDFNHDLAYGDIDGDGEGEVVALYIHDQPPASGTVMWYDVPADPTAGPWPATQITTIDTLGYVGLALGDLDGDTDVDVVASNEWYERPANPATPNWTARTLFADVVQNVFVYDVNGDNDLDVVAAEGFVNPDGRVLWAEAPDNPLTQPWTEHVVGSDLDGPENIWAGDLDGDGNTDIVSGAMGTSTGWNDNDSTLILFEGLNAAGTSWDMQPMAENVGISARINPVDIDDDGDIDFTADGNAEDHIYLWINASGSGTPVGCNTPPPNQDEFIYLPLMLNNALPAPVAPTVTTYQLTVNTQGEGSVTRTPNQSSYDAGQNVTLTAVPDPGWTFSNWSGDLSGSTNPAAVAMNGNKTITAVFTQQPPNIFYFENFSGYAANSDPAGWFDTMPDNSTSQDDSYYKIFDISGEKVLGTSSTATNIHSHYTGTGGAGLTTYEYTGRMMITDSSGGIGVTFLSQFPNTAAYYRLRRFGTTSPANAFHISPLGTSITSGTADTGIVPEPNVWYRFKIQVTVTGSHTQIQAKVWQNGTAEPASWQADAIDNSPGRLTSGTFGIGSHNAGHKYWDDLGVNDNS